VINFIKVSEDGPLSKALENAGYVNIWEFAALSYADIESLILDQNDKEKDIPLGKAHKSLLHIFCNHCDHQYCIGAPIGDDWFAVSADDFNAFCTMTTF